MVKAWAILQLQFSITAMPVMNAIHFLWCREVHWYHKYVWQVVPEVIMQVPYSQLVCWFVLYLLPENWAKRAHFSGFDEDQSPWGGYKEVWWRWSKTLPVGLFISSKISGCGHNSMPEYPTPLTTNHNCVNTYRSAKLYLKHFVLFFLFFGLSPVGPSTWDDIANNRSRIIKVRIEIGQSTTDGFRSTN